MVVDNVRELTEALEEYARAIGMIEENIPQFIKRVWKAITYTEEKLNVYHIAYAGHDFHPGDFNIITNIGTKWYVKAKSMQTVLDYYGFETTSPSSDNVIFVKLSRDRFSEEIPSNPEVDAYSRRCLYLTAKRGSVGNAYFTIIKTELFEVPSN